MKDETASKSSDGPGAEYRKYDYVIFGTVNGNIAQECLQIQLTTYVSSVLVWWAALQPVTWLPEDKEHFYWSRY